METCPEHLPNELAFVHFDTDTVDTVVNCLPQMWERLQPSGAILFDDYGFSPNCLPLSEAVDSFIKQAGKCFSFYLPSNGKILIKK